MCETKKTTDDFRHIKINNTMHNFASFRVLNGTEEEKEEEEEEEEEEERKEEKSTMRWTRAEEEEGEGGLVFCCFRF